MHRNTPSKRVPEFSREALNTFDNTYNNNQRNATDPTPHRTLNPSNQNPKETIITSDKMTRRQLQVESYFHGRLSNSSTYASFKVFIYHKSLLKPFRLPFTTPLITLHDQRPRSVIMVPPHRRSCSVRSNEAYSEH